MFANRLSTICVFREMEPTTPIAAMGNVGLMSNRGADWTFGVAKLNKQWSARAKPTPNSEEGTELAGDTDQRTVLTLHSLGRGDGVSRSNARNEGSFARLWKDKGRRWVGGISHTANNGFLSICDATLSYPELAKKKIDQKERRRKKAEESHVLGRWTPSTSMSKEGRYYGQRLLQLRP